MKQKKQKKIKIIFLGQEIYTSSLEGYIAKYKYSLRFYQKRYHNIFKNNFYPELEIDFFAIKTYKNLILRCFIL